MAHIPFFRRGNFAAKSPRTSKRWLTAALAAGLALGAGLALADNSCVNQYCPPPVPTPPKGLIALNQYPGCPATPYYEPPPVCPSGHFPGTVLRNASIAGLMIRIDWLDMYEPQAFSNIDWSITDAVFADAKASGKFVVLSFVPGFGSPLWVLEDPSVTTKMFCIAYGFVPGGNKHGQPSALPLPWDDNYLAQWILFLHQVYERYGNNPYFKMIAAAGPTSISEEMSLPGTEKPSTKPGFCNATQVAQDLNTWRGVGYTPDKYVAAWNVVFEYYAALFPQQFVSLAVFDGLPVGHTATAPFPRTDTPRLVVGAGAATASLNFAVEGNGLTPNSTNSTAYKLVQSSKMAPTSLTTGFELATSAYTSPAKQGDLMNWVNALCLSLQAGMDAGVDYLEIYEKDVEESWGNATASAVLATAANQLTVPGSPKLTCSPPP